MRTELSPDAELDVHVEQNEQEQAVSHVQVLEHEKEEQKCMPSTHQQRRRPHMLLVPAEHTLAPRAQRYVKRSKFASETLQKPFFSAIKSIS